MDDHNRHVTTAQFFTLEHTNLDQPQLRLWHPCRGA
jgi:hypothetical protein